MKNSLKAQVLGLIMLAVSLGAHAALPTEATAAFTTVTGYVTDILAAIWTILPISVGGFLLIRLFKKGTSKAV